MTAGLPAFELLTPRSLREATLLLAEGDEPLTIIAGGTDVVPKLERGQMSPYRLMSMTAIEELGGIKAGEDGSCRIGALTTLAELTRSSLVPEVLRIAASQVASPQIRNVGTVGGNLCLDTRCNYIDMSLHWRSANGHCLKDGGDTCWVAPRTDRCWAVSSSDLAPVAVALGASAQLVGPRGERVVEIADLYRNDGMRHMAIEADEMLTEVCVRSPDGPATYRKLRRRGSIDFPILGVAATATFDDRGVCTSSRIVLGAVASAPVRVTEAEELLVGMSWDSELIDQASAVAAKKARPMDNADSAARYRRWMAAVFVGRALEDLRASADEREGRPDGAG